MSSEPRQMAGSTKFLQPGTSSFGGAECVSEMMCPHRVLEWYETDDSQTEVRVQSIVMSNDVLMLRARHGVSTALAMLSPICLARLPRPRQLRWPACRSMLWSSR